jgi:hypothetical protein
MKIIDHGMWENYKPEHAPAELRSMNVSFCRRVSDGADWYEFQKQLRNDNIKMTVEPDGTVQATSRDASMLFPANMRVVEVEADIDHETLRQCVYDGQTFLPPLQREDPLIKTQALAFMRALGIEEDDLPYLRALVKKQRSEHG